MGIGYIFIPLEDRFKSKHFPPTGLNFLNSSLVKHVKFFKLYLSSKLLYFRKFTSIKSLNYREMEQFFLTL